MIADSWIEHRAVPAAGAAHGLAHRQVQGLQAGPQGHLGGEGGDAARCSTTSRPGRCSSTARSASSNEMPFSAMLIESFHMGLADGPTEVHKVTLARQVLSEYDAAPRACSRPATSRACARRRSPATATHRAPSRRAVSSSPGDEVDQGWSRHPSWLRSGRARSSTGRRSRPTCAAGVEGLDGPMEVLQFPNGSANLTYLLRFGDDRAGAAPAAVRRRSPPAPTTCAASTGCCPRLWQSLRPGAAGVPVLRRPRASSAPDFFVMERRRGEVVRDGVPAVDGPPSRRRPPGRASPWSTPWPTCTCSTRRRPSWPTWASPTGFPARQVAGWRDALGPGAPDDGRPIMDEVPARLAASLPGPTRVRSCTTTSSSTTASSTRPTPTGCSRSSTGT